MTKNLEKALLDSVQTTLSMLLAISEGEKLDPDVVKAEIDKLAQVEGEVLQVEHLNKRYYDLLEKKLANITPLEAEEQSELEMLRGRLRDLC